jgi:hypothetical protein
MSSLLYSSYTNAHVLYVHISYMNEKSVVNYINCFLPLLRLFLWHLMHVYYTYTYTDAYIGHTLCTYTVYRYA